jgi:hypothetical protein
MTNEHQCCESVRESGQWPRYHQCKRKAVKEGYCKQHHPDAVEARRYKAVARYEERRLRMLLLDKAFADKYYE